MVKLRHMVGYCDRLLEVERFTDYCPNGLQVEACDDVRFLASGVTASLALIERAVQARADALLVHHGFFWKGEAAAIIGAKARRIKALLGGGVSLLAYHLPLDAHAELGNNRQLAQRLSLKEAAAVGSADGLLWRGRLDVPLSARAFADRLTGCLGRVPLHIPGGDGDIREVAFCTGAAQGLIDQAIELGVDAYVSGEVSEQTVHLAREGGLHYFSAGHHATERYGVQALGEHLAKRFGLRHQYIEVDNPV